MTRAAFKWAIMGTTMILLASCGGKTVQRERSSSNAGGTGGAGGSPAVGGSGGSVAVGGTGGGAGTGSASGNGGAAGTGGSAGTGGAAGTGGSAGSKPWDHKCSCKDWTDDSYPDDFWGDYSCVLSGCPSDYVCCAVSCLSPEVCKWTGPFIVSHCGAYGLKSAPCCPYVPATCVLPEQCAPEGILETRPPTVNDKGSTGCFLF